MSALAGTEMAVEPKTLAAEALELDRFRLMAEWYHLAILSLGEIKGNRWDPEWIGKRLGIAPPTAFGAMERLLRLDMLKRSGVGFRQAKAAVIVNNSPVPASAIQKYHHENLEKALDSLKSYPVHLRDFSSITMARLSKYSEPVAPAFEPHFCASVIPRFLWSAWFFYRRNAE